MNYYGYSKRLFLVWAVTLLTILPGQVASALADDPLNQVRESVGKVFEILQDEQLKQPEMREERKKLVENEVDAVFDFKEMAKRSLAKYWKKRSVDEKTYFVGLFADLVKQRYIGKIDSYAGQEVEYRKQAVKGDRAVVKTVLIDKGLEISIDYILISKSGKWLAYDMRIENVSLVVNYRRDFASIIEKEKYSGLISRMEKKVRNLGAQ